MNYTILWLAFCFWVVESAHYGWNFVAKSDAEVICDGISMLIFSLAFLRSK